MSKISREYPRMEYAYLDAVLQFQNPVKLSICATLSRSRYGKDSGTILVGSVTLGRSPRVSFEELPRVGSDSSVNRNSCMDKTTSEDETWILANYVVVAASTLWIAEFIESVPTEVNIVWSRKKTGIAWLYLLNRYMLLVGLIFQALMILPGKGTDSVCQAINLCYASLVITTFALTSLLLALRVYAIYNKSRIILGLSSVMIIFIFALQIYIMALEPGISTTGSSVQDFSRCKLNPRVQIVVPFAVFGYDLFIFVFTVRKTSSVTQLIIRDGTLYFVFLVLEFGFRATLFLAATDLCLLVMSMRSGDTNYLFQLSGPFFNVFPNLLVNRFILNLNAFNTSGDIISSNQLPSSTHLSSVHFVSDRVLENFVTGEGGEEDREEGQEEGIEMETGV
ncbi:hypothetical protein EV360DRAFT_66001 [Lentinula raphanica]|nr:hypothetical protein EV360DRAFT_66001 [Lentinula raphanica]